MHSLVILQVFVWCSLPHFSFAYLADCSSFSIAPQSEYPYAYHIEGSRFYLAAQQACTSFHPQCQIAVVRNQATRVFLNTLMNNDMLRWTSYTCVNSFIGLTQNVSTTDPTGAWYWSDGRYYNPVDTSDERYFAGGAGIRGYKSPGVVMMTYGYNVTTDTANCDAWYAKNISTTYTWSFWELPSNFSSSSCI
jgi:hypothetical protein